MPQLSFPPTCLTPQHNSFLLPPADPATQDFLLASSVLSLFLSRALPRHQILPMLPYAFKTQAAQTGGGLECLVDDLACLKSVGQTWSCWAVPSLEEVVRAELAGVDLASVPGVLLDACALDGCGRPISNLVFWGGGGFWFHMR